MDVYEAADANVAAAVSLFGRYGAGSVLDVRPGLLLVAAASEYAGAFHNAALRTDPTADPHRVVDDMQSFGRAHRRDMVLWASTHRDQDLAEVAEARGLRIRSTAVGMALRTPPTVEQPGDIELVAADVDGFAAVHRDVVADVDAVPQFASAGVLLAPGVSSLVAYADGTPVSCAMAVRSGRTAGIYWVATRPAARRRGYGSLVTAAVARLGFEQGAEVVVLQATAMGAPVYEALGFEAFTEYRRFGQPGSR
ncbi:GNAT family N-acetyltransferase [Kribbella karoonensis]|uniref:N-acetyltransferase domain-containing protein n=1 Tax=Kribbella karoonensis TaxID=324851 RepID=A0ABN2EFT4_9ACTN